MLRIACMTSGITLRITCRIVEPRRTNGESSGSAPIAAARIIRPMYVASTAQVLAGRAVGGTVTDVTRYVTETDRNGTPAPAPAPAPSTEKNGSSALLAEPPAPPLVIFPCVGKGFDSWALTEAQRNDWAKAYPALDIVSECRKACTWLAANPTRRKTARGMPAFLVGWLNRSTNRGGTVGLTALNGSRPGSAPQPIVGDWRADCSHDPPCSHPAMCEHRRRKGAMA